MGTLYLQDYQIYYKLYKKILDNYNVEKRLEWVKVKKDSNLNMDNFSGEKATSLKEIEKSVNNPCERVILIIRDLMQNVHSGYASLLDEAGVPGDLVTDLDNCDIEEICRQYMNLRFCQNIRVAQFFQLQYSLHDLRTLNSQSQNKDQQTGTDSGKREDQTSTGEIKKGDLTDRIWTFRVHSLTELQFYILECCKRLRNTAQKMKLDEKYVSTVWFRGLSRESYFNIPTVIREYERKKFTDISLQAYQFSNFEEFKFIADGSAEMPVGVAFTLSDYLALMQHYGAATNFLDWTDNAFISLYLALKYYCKDNKEKGREDSPVLSIFHPGVYNKIRKKCMSKLESEALNDKIAWVNKMSCLHPKSLLPNISMNVNERQYGMFLLGDDEFESYIKGQDLIPYRDLFLPVAVLTSRLNSRIKTQNGNFVAYNLYAPPEKGKDYSYYCLDNIQERMKKEEIFLYRIVIDKECAGEVVAWLESMGISKKSVYPELSEKTVRKS